MVEATRLGAWLRSGEGIGRFAAGTIPNSLYRVPFFYLFLACVFCYCSFLFVAPRPSVSININCIPKSRGKMSKRLGGIIGCKYKTSSWHLNGFPNGSNIGSTV